jgi:fibronectin type 3 domain-containing protein
MLNNLSRYGLGAASVAALAAGASAVGARPAGRPAAKAAPKPAPKAARAAALRTLQERLAQAPLRFEPNRGQTLPGIKFLARGGGYGCYVTGDGALLRLRKGGERRPTTVGAVRMRLRGANPGAVAEGAKPLPTKASYFTSEDRSKWRSGLPTFAQVRQSEIYPGIDVVYYGNQRRLEYDFVVKPGADPSRVRLAYEGADSVRLEKDGDLEITSGGGAFTQHLPVAYQEIGGRRKPVECRYVQKGGEVRLAVGAYDRKRTLVIDPVLSYATYFGGDGEDSILGMTSDNAVGVYITGFTDELPVTYGVGPPGGDGDAFVAQVGAGGGLVFATYLGAGGAQAGRDVTLDNDGFIYVTGATAGGFPSAPEENQLTKNISGGDDVFVVKLRPGGQELDIASVIGHIPHDPAPIPVAFGDDVGTGVGVDKDGHVYVTGDTYSADFPRFNSLPILSNGGRSAFVLRLATDGRFYEYSTYLTGGGFGYETNAVSLAVTPEGHAFVAGSTTAPSFPMVNPVQSGIGGGMDAFVAELAPTGNNILFSTYLGGIGDDSCTSMVRDESGIIWLTGGTKSPDFPTINPQDGTLGGVQDAYLSAINPGRSSLFYSTFLGGDGDDAGTGVAVDQGAHPYVTGTTTGGFPLVSAPQATYGGGPTDGFVTEYDANAATIVFSTYIGGGATDEPAGVGIDVFGGIYVAGTTFSADFPTTGAFDGGLDGGKDGFVVQILDPPSAPKDLAALEVGTTTVDLTWEENSNNETSFRIERKTGAGVFTEIRMVPANSTFFRDTNLDPATNYSYRVRAGRVNVFSDYTNTVAVKTAARLATPTELVAEAVSATRIKLTWKDNSTGETGFTVERRPEGGEFVQAVIAPANATTINDHGLRPGTQYTYRVRAYSDTDVSLFSKEATDVTIEAPSAPADLQAVPVSDTEIKLAWRDTSATEEGFRIERKSGTEDFAEIGLVGKNVRTFNDLGVTRNVDYTYRVRAYNDEVVSGYSNEAQVIRPATKPEAPSGLTGEVQSSNKIVISWIDNSDNEEGFRVYRDSGSGFVLRRTLPAGTTSFEDNALASSTTYRYQVSAFNHVGESDKTETLVKTTKPEAPTDLQAEVLSPSEIKLVWRDPNTNPVRFRIERRGKKPNFSEIARTEPGATSFVDSTAQKNTTYTYRVQAFIDENVSAFSNEATVTTPQVKPDAPTNLRVTSVTAHTVGLKWKDNSDNELSFNVYRDSGSGFRLIASLEAKAKTYEDTKLKSGTTYRYRVAAANEAGLSDFSNVKTVRTLPEIVSLVIKDSEVNRGDSTEGRVTLSGPAPEGGAEIKLTSSSASVDVPETITLRKGQTWDTFTIRTDRHGAAGTVTITAQYGDSKKTAKLKVKRL